MKKRGKVKMILIGILAVFLCMFVYFNIPYSPVKNEYWQKVDMFINDYDISTKEIWEKDLEVLPEILQKYFIENGYLGVESANAVILDFKDADFSLGVDKAKIKIDYTVYDFVKEPTRLALIDSKMYGVPFQGIDTCNDGQASMKGVLAKHITLFNEKFDFIDSAYLSECLMHPSLALQDNITYRQIDDYSVKATIKQDNVETSGTFYFNKNYEMTSFVDKERFHSDTNTNEKWTAVAANYKVIDGINKPTKLQAIWNFDSGDLIYFDSNNMEISYE